MYRYSVFSYMFQHFKCYHQGVKHDPAEIGALCHGKQRRMEAVCRNRWRDGQYITEWRSPIGLVHSVISQPSHRILQYTASILLCFPWHWTPISAGSCLTLWWWHFKVPKHVGEYWVPIHWMINAFVGFSFPLRKCMVQNAKTFSSKFKPLNS
jgi:hypothetical protein